MRLRKIPLYSTHPAILLPGMKFHPLVLVEGTRLGRLCRPVRIPPPVLAVRTLVSVWSHLLECAPPGGGSNACSAVLCPPHILAAGMRGV